VDETSRHTFCECEALASLRHVYLGSSFLVQSLFGGHLEVWQRNRVLLNWYQIMGHKGPIFKAWVHQEHKDFKRTANQSSNQSINTNIKNDQGPHE